jgi:peptide/nickel transport system substrate-binding protein
MILGDIKVRQAIAVAINKDRIVKQLLNGKVPTGTSDLNVGPFACPDIKTYPYDVALAKKLLDEAGWLAGSDGIRVAKGAKYAPDGTRLRLKYSTTSGNKLREQTQSLVQEDLRAVGIDAFIENGPSSVVIGNWDAGAPRKRGNFDLVQWTNNAGIDPHTEMINDYNSKQIPSPTTTGGMNIARFNDPKVDALLEQAGQEPDMNKRKTMYCQVVQAGADAYIMVHLYQAANATAFRDRVQGGIGNGFNTVSWNSADWWIK